MKTIVRDEFTQRLLDVWKYLHNNKIVTKKKAFAELIGIPASTFSNIETALRNFPKELQAFAAMQLATEYFVNPAYMNARTNQMFTQEPKAPVQLQPGDENNREIYTYGYKQKQKLEEENKALKAQLMAVEEELSKAKEQLAKCKGRSDRSPDK